MYQLLSSKEKNLPYRAYHVFACHPLLKSLVAPFNLGGCFLCPIAIGGDQIPPADNSIRKCIKI